MALEGFEPSTLWFVATRSNPLSYRVLEAMLVFATSYLVLQASTSLFGFIAKTTGLGFGPRLPGSEPSVLPLHNPVKFVESERRGLHPRSRHWQCRALLLSYARILPE